MKKFSKFLVCATVAVSMIISLYGCDAIFLSQSSDNSSESDSSGSSASAGNNTFEQKITGTLNVTVHEAGADAIGSTDLTDTLDRIRPSVVEVYATVTNGTSCGSGVIFDIEDADQNGTKDYAYIVTCHHVIDGSTCVTVKTIYGKEYEAYLIGSDPNSDIGVICIKATDDNNLDNLTYATWCKDSDNLKIGTDVVAIGNPLGYLGGTVTKGIISAINRDVSVEGKEMNLIQTDAAINGGNSGGGLFTTTGYLVGIVNAGYDSSDAQGLSFAIPANDVKEIKTKLLNTYGGTYDYGYVEGNYKLGADFSLVQYGFRDYGVAVSDIDEYGAFYRAGLRVYDIIETISINDKSISITDISSYSVTNLENFLSGITCSVGDEMTVKYLKRSSSGSYSESTIKFDIPQYVYGYSGS